MTDERSFEAARRPLPDWALAVGVFLAWLLLRNKTYPSLPMSAGVDLFLVVITAAVVAHFEAGDPPRRGWWLALGTFTCAGIGISLRDQPFAAAGRDYWMHVYLAVNVFWSSTILVFAHNVWSSGLRPRWTPLSRVVVGACVLLALGVGAILMHTTVGAWIESGHSTEPEHLGSLLMNGSSAIADPLVFVGAVLIAHTMLPMGGGAIMRPYLLLSFSAAAYLSLDLITLLKPDFWKVTGQIVFSFGEGFFVAAAACAIQLARRDR